MGKIISGILTCKIEFHDVYVDDNQSELDAIFPEGWEGEMTSEDLMITEEIEEE